MSESGEVTFPHGNISSVVHSGLKTKFTAVQEVIVRYFIETKYKSLTSTTLGSLLVRPPSARVGGSELDSFRFSLILIEIMHLLLRFGFYYNESLLVELMHTVFGILSSHKYRPDKDQFDFEPTPENLDIYSDDENDVELSNLPKQTKEAPKANATSTPSDDSLISWITNPQNQLTSDVDDGPRGVETKIEMNAPAPPPRAPTKQLLPSGKSSRALTPLVKSEELIRICRRHNSVFANKQQTEDESKEVEVIEHQL